MFFATGFCEFGLAKFLLNFFDKLKFFEKNLKLCFLQPVFVNRWPEALAKFS